MCSSVPPSEFDDSRLGDHGGGSAVTARDSTPNPTLLARVACGPVLSFDAIVYMWRYVARSE